MINALFALGLLGTLPLNVFAWWQFMRAAPDESRASLRRRATTIGLVANTVTAVLPWLSFAANVIRPDGLGLSTGAFILAGLIFAVASIVIGAFAQSRVRLPLIMASVLACYFWLILPSGIGVL